MPSYVDDDRTNYSTSLGFGRTHTPPDPTDQEKILSHAIIRWYRASAHEQPRHRQTAAERNLATIAKRLLGEDDAA